MTFGRRSAQKGFRGFWFGISTGALIMGVVLAANYFGVLQ